MSLRRMDWPLAIAYVIKNNDEGKAILKNMTIDKIHGEAGERIIIEQFLQE